MPFFGVQGMKENEYSREHHVGKPFGPSETETAGAMTMRQQIQRLLSAGYVQTQWRRAHFPPDTDIPDNFVPPAYASTEQELLDEHRRIVNGKAASRGEARQQTVDKQNEPPAVEETPPVEEPAPAE